MGNAAAKAPSSPSVSSAPGSGPGSRTNSRPSSRSSRGSVAIERYHDLDGSTPPPPAPAQNARSSSPAGRAAGYKRSSSNDQLNRRIERERNASYRGPGTLPSSLVPRSKSDSNLANSTIVNAVPTSELPTVSRETRPSVQVPHTARRSISHTRVLPVVQAQASSPADRAFADTKA